MNIRSRSFGIRSLVLSLAALAAFGATTWAGDRAPGRTPTDNPAPHPIGGHGRHRGHRRHRRPHPAQFLRQLQLTDAQKAAALQTARDLAPVARSTREQVRQIMADARAAHPNADRATIREAARPQLEALRERAAAQLTERGRPLVQSLTPEQRARIEARLAEHGRTFDADRAARRVAFVLSRPRVLEHMEERAR